MRRALFASAALVVAVPGSVTATTVDLSDTVAPVPRSAIAGAWDVDTSLGYRFRYFLTAEGSGLGPVGQELTILVKGQIVNTDGKDELSGGLQGTIPAGSLTLVYSFVQKDGNSGTGKLTLSNDGRSIGGVARIGRQRFSMDGARVQ